MKVYFWLVISFLSLTSAFAAPPTHSFHLDRTLTPPMLGPLGFTLTPDGSSFLSTSGLTLESWGIWNTQGSLSYHLAQGTLPCGGFQASFSQSGKLLTLRSVTSTTGIWQTATGALLFALPTSAKNGAAGAFSADEKFFFTVGDPSPRSSANVVVNQWDLHTGGNTGTFSIPVGANAHIASISVSSSTELWAIVMGIAPNEHSAHFQKWDLRTQSVTQDFPLADNIFRPYLFPNIDRILITEIIPGTASMKNTTWNSNGAKLSEVAWDPTRVTHTDEFAVSADVISADGKHLLVLYSVGGWTFIDIGAQKVIDEQALPGQHWGAAVNHDGSEFYIVTRTGELQVWK